MKLRSGVIELARRVRDPLIQAIDIADAAVLSPLTCKVTLSNPLPQGEFIGGHLTSGSLTGRITAISYDRTQVEISRDDLSEGELTGNQHLSEPMCTPRTNAPTNTFLYPRGPAFASENSAAPTLWKPVPTTFPVTALPSKLMVNEDVPPLPSDGIDTLVYAARVRFNNFDGKTIDGQFSNTVSASRKSRPPQSPPPFMMNLLGWDYFQRLVISVVLTDPIESLCAVAWNLGRKSQFLEGGNIAGPASKSFAAAAISGLFGPQKPHHNNILVEVLEIPEPHFLDAYVTVGVKRIDSLGQESKYTVDEVLIEAE